MLDRPAGLVGAAGGGAVEGHRAREPVAGREQGARSRGQVAGCREEGGGIGGAGGGADGAVAAVSGG